jgi:hypothetical protein
LPDDHLIEIAQLHDAGRVRLRASLKDYRRRPDKADLLDQVNMAEASLKLYFHRGRWRKGLIEVAGTLAVVRFLAVEGTLTIARTLAIAGTFAIAWPARIVSIAGAAGTIPVARTIATGTSTVGGTSIHTGDRLLALAAATIAPGGLAGSGPVETPG